jgi:hypothetical protein
MSLRERFGDLPPGLIRLTGWSESFWADAYVASRTIRSVPDHRCLRLQCPIGLLRLALDAPRIDGQTRLRKLREPMTVKMLVSLLSIGYRWNPSLVAGVTQHQGQVARCPTCSGIVGASVSLGS